MIEFYYIDIIKIHDIVRYLRVRDRNWTLIYTSRLRVPWKLISWLSIATVQNSYLCKPASRLSIYLVYSTTVQCSCAQFGPVGCHCTKTRVFSQEPVATSLGYRTLLAFIIYFHKATSGQIVLSLKLIHILINALKFQVAKIFLVLRCAKLKTEHAQ